jgi:arylsulfatase A-like enzyme
LTPEQQQAWDAVYVPQNEAFQKANLQGDDLIRWKYQRYMKDYLRCIDSVDENVGRLLDYLDANGLAENTIVVYTSDQGFFLGDHGWFDKRFMYEESLRMPLLVRYPQRAKAGTTVSQLVQNLDFAQTFLDYAGVDAPGDMQGRSLRPLLEDKSPLDWRDAVYYHYYEYPAEHSVKRHYGIRTERYKLLHFYYDIDEWELYDLQADPEEKHNLYHDPAHQDLVARLTRRLRALQAQYGDSDELAQQYLDEYLEGIKPKK